MSGCDWIVCERTSRWAAALRLALERDGAKSGPHHRIRETRRLSELTAEVLERPACIAAIETHHDNFADVLEWLSTADLRFPAARSVVLVDRSIGLSERHETRIALREAGALEVVESPRQLGSLIELGRRPAPTSKNVAAIAENSPLVERIWASLPWQAG